VFPSLTIISYFSISLELIPQQALCAVSLRLNLEVEKGVKLIESPAGGGRLQRPQQRWLCCGSKLTLTRELLYPQEISRPRHIYRIILLTTESGWEFGWQIGHRLDKLWIAHMFRYLAKGKHIHQLTNLATTLQTSLYQSITFVSIYQMLQIDSCTLAATENRKLLRLNCNFPNRCSRFGSFLFHFPFLIVSGYLFSIISAHLNILPFPPMESKLIC